MPLAEGREVSAVTADGVPVALSPEALFPFPTTAPVPFILTPRLLPSECRRPVTSSPNFSSLGTVSAHGGPTA